MNRKELVEKIQYQIDNTRKLYEEQNTSAIRQQLYELYQNFNKPGGGSLIVNYPEKEKLGECFSLMLIFDWINDNNIREVWAENGFFCYVEHLNTIHTQEEQVLGGCGLFQHLFHGRKHLIPKVKDILIKAKQKNAFIFDDCILPSPFDEKDYNNGAEYVINQFVFLSARMMMPIVLMDKNFLAVNETKFFNDTLNDKTFNNLDPVAIFNKARFVKRIIGSAIEEV